MARKPDSKFDRTLPRELMQDKPACFTQAQWDRWVAGELSSPLPVDPNGYCGECLPSFKLAMMQQGKCRHRDSVFSISVEDNEQQIVCSRHRYDQVREFATADESVAFRDKYIPIIAAIKIEHLTVRDQLAAAPEGAVL